MLKPLCLSLALVAAAACAAPRDAAGRDGADLFENEPVVVHLDIGGLT